jgi:hypothetical protein
MFHADSLCVLSTIMEQPSVFGSLFKKKDAVPESSDSPKAGMFSFMKKPAAPAAGMAAPTGVPTTGGSSEKQVVLMGLVHKKQKWRGQWVERFFQVEDTQLSYKYPMNKVRSR